jgi:GntR family transcriptional regulator
MIPPKEEGPPPPEGPSEDVMSVGTTPATTATASTSEGNTGGIHLSRVNPSPQVVIWSELSIVNLVAASDRRLIGHHDLHILVNLLGRAGKEAAHWQCWPSIGTVARELGVHSSTVKRAIRRFERFGYLERLNRYVDNRQTSNVYRFKLPDYTELPEGNPYAAEPIRDIAQVPGGGVHGSRGEGGTGAPPRGGTRAPQKTFNELPLMNSTKEAAEQVEKEADQHLNGKERSEEEKRESNGKGNPKAISEWLDRRRGVR